MGGYAEGASDWVQQPIAALKAVRLSEYNGGKNLTMMGSSSFALNPPTLDEAKRLFHWANDFGQNPQGGFAFPAFHSVSGGGGGASTFGQVDPLERRVPISATKEPGVGMGDKPDMLSFKAFITYMKHDSDPWYAACTSPNCSKKVIPMTGGGFRCEKCDISMQDCHYRYILSATMSDASGQTWFTVFNDQAEKLLGYPAEQLQQWRALASVPDHPDSLQADANFEGVFADALFKQVLVKARVKMEASNRDDGDRLKVSASVVQEINFVEESKAMLDAIMKYPCASSSGGSSTHAMGGSIYGH